MKFDRGRLEVRSSEQGRLRPITFYKPPYKETLLVSKLLSIINNNRPTKPYQDKSKSIFVFGWLEFLHKPIKELSVRDGVNQG